MASTSPAELAARILERCLAGERIPDTELMPLIEQAAGEGPEAAEASGAFFGQVVEPLADRFEPALCDAYVDLFARVLGIVDGDDPEKIRLRYERVRKTRAWRRRHPERVVVLSRVTLGADIAITSVILDGLKKRFPEAEVVLAGGRKSWELFADDARVGWLDVPYPRSGSLRDRLRAGRRLGELVGGEGTLVVDPDSRLTQLGVLPVGDESQYCFFESRAAGGEGDSPLGALAAEWVAAVFGVEGATSYMAPRGLPASRSRRIAVSYGVGENQSKRIGDSFESELLRGLAESGLPVLIDRGPGGEEARRVARAVEAAGAGAGQVEVFEGPFADFAARIAGSRLFVGYDSAGQHAAAATGTPAVAAFSGYPSRRFVERWSGSCGGPVTSLALAGVAPEVALVRVLSKAREHLEDVV